MAFKSNLIDKLSHTTFLLAFIFCGAIVGENLSLSLVVSKFGSSVLSKMYLVNGILLFGLPLIFFGYIDKVDRGKLLSKILLLCSIALVGILLLIKIIEQTASDWVAILQTVLYPFSYLSKTILFLTFWTFANDIFPTEIAKKKFPIIAAWGIVGGFSGSCIASIFIKIVSIEMLIALWAMSYYVAWIFSKKLSKRYEKKLNRHEKLHENVFYKKRYRSIQHYPSLILLSLMACQYFLVFLAIFALDYLFWNNCRIWFGTPESIAGFQFTFYLVHASITVLGLRFLLPRVIAGVGFTRIFYCLPGVLFSGSIILLIVTYTRPEGSFFFVFTGVQFLRYLIFENAYAPIYQMYFAAIEKEKRGRAKMLIEGIVKPGAIIVCGLILLFLNGNTNMVLVLIAICGGLAIVNAVYIRRTYTRALIPQTLTILEPQTIISEFAGDFDRDFMDLAGRYAKSEESDMRIIAIKLLAVSGSLQAFEELKRFYAIEQKQKVKEIIARSLSGFYSYTSKPFIEGLLNEPNQRIRANALYSLNRMHCNWKRYLKAHVKNVLNEKNVRVQIEAYCYLWDNGDQQDRQNAENYVKSLLYNTNINRQSAGVYLTGIIKQSHWELELINKVHSPNIHVYKRTIETVFGIESEQLHLKVLRIIELKDREHISIAGKVIEKQGISVWDTLIEFLPKVKNRRMIYELIRCMRLLSDSIRLSGELIQLTENTSDSIKSWIKTELELIYKCSYYWYQCKEEIKGYIDTSIMDDALRENLTRSCEWAIDAMVLLDKDGVLTWRYNDIDIRDHSQRADLVEIIEETSYEGVGSMILPILRKESWEIIAESGKTFFKFDEYYGKNGLIYFLNSDNRWISLCSMYILSKLPNEFWSIEIVSAMKRIEDDSEDQLIASSTEFLKRKFYGSRKKYAVDLLERVLFLKATPLFKNVNSEKLMKLAEIAQQVNYEPGEVISKQGDISEHLYVVITGRIKVLKNIDELSVQVSIIKSAETYGEIGLFNQSPRSATAIAIDECLLLVIKRVELKRMLMEVPDIAINLLEVFSDRLKKSGEEIVELARKEQKEQTGLF